jgi:tetratricopeptide (TPR) repeat protein
LLPGSSIVPLAEVTNDHRAFLAYIGLALAAGVGDCDPGAAATARSRRVAALSATLVVLVAIGANAVGTYERNKDWASEETLWRDVVEKSPANGRAWMNYGLTQMSKGQYDEAKRLFERALQYSPNYHLIEVNLGIVRHSSVRTLPLNSISRGRSNYSRETLGRTYFFARWLVQQGRLTEGIAHLQRAIGLSPANLDARYMLMNHIRDGRTH